MKLLTIHKENFVNIVENVSGGLIDKYPDVFDKGLGTIPGKVHLQVHPGCLESVLHSPQQQCLVPTIFLLSRTINRRID